MNGWMWVAIVFAATSVTAGALFFVRRHTCVVQLVRGLEALRDDRPVRPVTGHFFGELGKVVRLYNELIPSRATRLLALENDRLVYETVLEGMSEGVIAVDSRRRLLFANGTSRSLFGLEASDQGRLFAEVVRHPQLQSVVDATMQSDTFHREEVVLNAGRWPGTRVGAAVLAVHARPLSGAALQGAVLVFHDVTGLRRLERMRQDFVANVSHELKTPLAAIKAYAETLLDGAIDDPAVNHEFLQRIDEQTDRLNQLVFDMLSLSRLESGQDAFLHRPLSVAPVIRAIAESHQARAIAKKQELLLRLGNVDESVLVRVDDEALRQILNNLIENAIKYTPPNGRVVIACRARDENVEFEVIDTGIGIARSELPRVFERFYRVDKSRARDDGGTGLGLAIVKHLVQSLGGRVTVRSRLNAGSTFTISLPRARPGTMVERASETVAIA